MIMVLMMNSLPKIIILQNEYSIVECNDAWSLGLYKGSISQEIIFLCYGEGGRN